MLKILKFSYYSINLFIICNAILYFDSIIASQTDIEKESNDTVCILRGVCEQTDYGAIPCVEKNQPILLRQIPQNVRSISLLEAMCPHLYDKDEPYICCDELQLESMYIVIYKFAHFGFNHCPSCLRNLEKLFCQLHCSPKQNQFIKVRKIIKESGNYLAADIDYFISESFASGIFNSCKDVRNSKGKVLDKMCGGLKGSDCTAEHWLDYIGQSTEEGGISPFKINFHITKETVVKVGNNTYVPEDESYVKCSESSSKESKACECLHCPDSCNNNRRHELKKDQMSQQIKTSHLTREKRQSNKCLIRGICDESAFGGIPCVSNEEPTPISDPVALEELKEMCPHLVTSDSPTVCCTEDQIIQLNQTFEMLSMFLKECPACVRNFEKVICHLSCATDQETFMRITQTSKNDDQKDMVSEVEYFVNDDWIKGIYDSCKGVHRLGFNVLDHYCKPYKSQDCDHQKFLQFIGGDVEHFGHSPFEINFIFTNDESVTSNGVEYKPVKQSFYKCSDNPHTGEGKCPCMHCDQSCAPGEAKSIEKTLPKFKPKSKRETQVIENKSKSRSKRQDNGICLMRGVCSETAFGSIPCVSNEGPAPISDPVALEELKEMCPHLVTSDSPTVCCTEDQVISLNHTFEMLSTFLKECPACVRNFEKVICHLSCATDQQKFMKITKTKPNQSGKQMVSELQYYLNDDWAKGVYDSCKGVHRLGFNVLDHYCKPYKSQDCDHQKFLQFIGGDAEHFGHSPFEINFVFTNDVTVNADGVNYSPVKEAFYECSDDPHTGEGKCPCVHCDQSCAPGEAKSIEKTLPKLKPKSKRETETELLESDSDQLAQQFESDSQEQYCIFDNICSHDSRVGNFPCLKIRKPKPLSDIEAVETLRHICPQLVTNDQPMTCCEASHIYHLSAAFILPAKLGLATCPSCLHNFRQILCQFTCSPRQNQFIRIVNATKLEAKHTIIDHLEYYMNADFAQGLFDSCKSLHKGNVMNMMCGKWGRNKECSPRKWLDFMGLSTKNGGYSPFQMDVKLTKESSVTANGKTFYPMNEKAFSCAELPTPGSIPCGCSDCEDACMS